MTSPIIGANAPRVLGFAGILGGVVIAGGAATMPKPTQTQIQDLPEPGGAFGPVFLFGPIPLYDVLDPPEPGGPSDRQGAVRAGGGDHPLAGVRLRTPRPPLGRPSKNPPRVRSYQT